MKQYAAFAFLALSTLGSTASTAQTAELDRDRYETRQSADQTRGHLRRYVDRRREYRRQAADQYRNEYPVQPRAIDGTGYVPYASPTRNWRYSTFAVGQRIAPAYYSSRYHIDPQRYGLSPVSGSVRWVRYGDDVVRINTATGRVIAIRQRYFRR